MVFYIASPIYQQIIHKTIHENGLIVEGYESTRDLYLRKYIRANITKLDTLEHIIIDLTALNDTDEEITEAVKTLKIMANNTRIIILACNRATGDELLSKLFQMGIYDLITADDFNDIREQLQYSIVHGNQYKDAIRYEDVKNGHEKVVTRMEVKQVVNKVMLAFAGAQGHIGTTHNCIVLANALRKKGYMVAVVEYNSSGCFEQIRESFDEKLYESYFTMNGVDFYPGVVGEQLGSILGKSYNFVLVDFGVYSHCDQIVFNKANERFIVLGSKPWELDNANQIFVLANEAAPYYHYLFNFTPAENFKDIKEGMTGIESVHFLEYSENPFKSSNFADVDNILKNYLPIQQDINPKKKGLFKRK